MIARRPDPDYQGFADLCQYQREGVDFQVHVQSRPGSSVAVVAPHGGEIEVGTSQLARAIAGDELNLYLFEGIKAADNYRTLHLTSHRFDEPRCLELLSRCDHVLVIHGCRGEARQVLLGGLDAELKRRVMAALTASRVAVRTAGHFFQGTEPRNICNRGRHGLGVQIELTTALRMGVAPDALAAPIRSALRLGPAQHPAGRP